MNINFIIICFIGFMMSSFHTEEQVNLFDQIHPTPNNGKVFVIAHRGAHNGIPENTLAAYKEAIALGCDFVEVDIRRTKDGKFVSIHNSSIDAYTDEFRGKVNNFTLAELKEINIGKRFDPKWNDERIPTFEEILELCKNKIGIYLDLKEPYIDELVEIVKQYGMEQNIVWYIPVSRTTALKALREKCEKCFIMPDPDLGEIEETILVHKPSVIAPVMSQFNPEYLELAHINNVKVFVDEADGTVEEWARIIELGIDGIQTDHPEELIKYINTLRN